MKTQKQQGFTIIEVVLVLAIAGLIFLVVFLAVPALQSGQRDQQRTSDLSRLQTAVESYRSNNRGNLPFTNTTTVNNFVNSYLRTAGESFMSPSGTDYTVTNYTGASPVTYNFSGNQNTVFYRVGAKCGATEGSFVGAGARDYIVFMHLEGGGIACQNN